MISEYATEKVKFSIKFFLQHMVQQFIILVRFTDQGIRNIKDTTRRADREPLQEVKQKRLVANLLYIGHLENMMV